MTVEMHLKLPGVELPALQPGQMRYVLAREGPYLERRTTMYTTATPTRGPFLGLQPHGAHCVLHCGTIPVTLTRMMLAFFRDAYAIHEGEAALVLLYHPGNGVFRWHCPTQTVDVYRSWSGKLRATDIIHYDMPLEVPEGYVIFGDAHSHGSLSAHPSGIDATDEKYKDGLHIIVGKMDRPGPSEFHVDFVMDNQRFGLAPETVFADIKCEPFASSSPGWLKQIQLKEYMSWSSMDTNRTWNDGYGTKKSKQGYWEWR